MNIKSKIMLALIGAGAILGGCTVNDTPDNVVVPDNKPDVVVTPQDKPDVIITPPASTTGK